MRLAELSFWFLIVAYAIGVALGIGNRIIYSESSLTLTTLACGTAIFLVVAVSVLLKRPDVLAHLGCAFLIWIYVPFCVAAGLFDCALGIDEGLIRFKDVYSPAVTSCAMFVLGMTVWLTVSYLRAVAENHETRIRPFWLKSVLLQLIATPVLLFALGWF